MSCASAWQHLFALVQGHKIVVALLLTSGISTMPAPGSKLAWRTFYTWLYDWSHQFLNLLRPTRPATPPDAPKP